MAAIGIGRAIRRVCVSMLGLGWAAGSGVPAAAAPASARSEAPIRDVVLKSGNHRYTVPIQVGSATLEAGIDTGSVGLRVMPGAVEAGDAKPGPRTSNYDYTSGVRLSGHEGRAQLTIGAVSGASALQIVETVECWREGYGCYAKEVGPTDFTMMGDPRKGEGFKAILGLGLAKSVVPNPLLDLGVRRWIVELPVPGSGKPGRIVFNPTPEETAGFTMFALNPHSPFTGDMQDAIPICLINNATKGSICGPASLDTGALQLTVNNSAAQAWPANTPATIAFMQNGAVREAVDFATGQTKFESRLVFQDTANRPGVWMRLGLMPYLAYSVLYDPQARAIGLKARSDSVLAVQRAAPPVASTTR